MQVFKW